MFYRILPHGFCALSSVRVFLSVNTCSRTLDERERERERETERQRERDRAEKDENGPILRQTYLKKYIKTGKV